MTTQIESSCIALDDHAAVDSSVVGSKSANLARLRSLGHRVPDGVVVLPYGDANKSAQEVVARFGDIRLAVRSSSLAEDLAAASYAGQYETVLNVSGVDELSYAIETVRASSLAPSNRGYGREGRTGTMPVLIMPMVPADAAGVLFTANPVTGDSEIVIEAVAGLGESLVSGAATPQRWIAGSRSDSDEETDLLTPSQLADLAALGRRIAKEMGSHQDIEWVLSDDQIWVLQSRPITALPVEPGDESPGDREIWQRDAGFSGPTRMAEISAWAPVFEATTRSVFAEIGAPLDYMTIRRIGGWTYLRAVPPMDQGKDDMKPPPAIVFGLLMRIVPAFRRQLTRATATWEEGLGEKVANDWLTGGREALRADARKLRSVPLASISDRELGSHLESVIAQLQAASDAHFRIPVLATFLPMGRLGVFCERALGWNPEKAAQLVQGYAGDSSLVDALDRLATSADEDGTPDPTALEDFLIEHGHQTIGVDLAQPTWAEDPTPLLAMLRMRSRKDAKPTTGPSMSEVTEAEARQMLQGAEREEFDKALRLARHGAALGDETETDVLQAFALLRYAMNEIGRRLHDRGSLETPDDVLHLTVTEAREMVENDHPHVDVRRRKAEYAWALAHPGPDRIGPEPPPWPDMRYAPPGARPFLESMVWVMTHLEGEPASQDMDDGSRLSGFPASPGVVTGPVRVIKDPTEFGRIRPGDVLVCPATIAAWSVVFPQIAAIVTERGGPLSHPGILAREYGIPAVLSVRAATTTFQDGELVIVNGTEGTVTGAG